jgi:hypothetical protein
MPRASLDRPAVRLGVRLEVGLLGVGLLEGGGKGDVGSSMM